MCSMFLTVEGTTKDIITRPKAARIDKQIKPGKDFRDNETNECS